MVQCDRKAGITNSVANAVATTIQPSISYPFVVICYPDELLPQREREFTKSFDSSNGGIGRLATGGELRETAEQMIPHHASSEGNSTSLRIRMTAEACRARSQQSRFAFERER